MTDAKQPDIDEIVSSWQDYFKEHPDWQKLTEGVEPKATGCGPVYELGNPVGQFDQSMAIADMRGIKYAVPHYHANGETEIYIVLDGAGQVVVGGKVMLLEKGTVIVTPTNTAHYAIPSEGLVLAVVNTPPFNPDNNIDVTESNPSVQYDHEQFKTLIGEDE